MLTLVAACATPDATGAGPPVPAASTPAGSTTGATTVSPTPPTSESASTSAADPAPSSDTTSPSPPPASTVPPASTPAAAPVSHGSLPTSIQPVGRGELTGFSVLRGSTTLLAAQSSGLARYSSSARCEVPGQPCYDAPTFDQVARIDLGAPPTVPGKDTTFITGHSNRYLPDDPGKGVFSRLQNVRTGDVLVLTTTTGTFVYDVSKTLTVAFDQLTTTDDVVRVQPNTVVAISCVIAPNRASYLGNYVVIGTLRASAPA